MKHIRINPLQINENLSYKTLSVIIVILSVLIVLLLKIRANPHPAAAGWWDDTYHYRQSISITPGSAAVTDFQIKIEDVGTSALTAATKLQSDCGDIRFTSASGQPLPYWIEAGHCNVGTGTTSDIWVKVDSIPVSVGTTIFMYYGNPSADNGSNGDDTFIFFDDFEDGALDNWSVGSTNYGSWTASSAVSVGGTYSAYGQDTSTSGYPTLDRAISLGSFVLEQNIRVGETNLYHYPFFWKDQASGSLYWGLPSNNGYWQHYLGAAYSNYPTAQTYAANTWYKQIIKFDSSAGTHDLWINTTDLGTTSAKNSGGTTTTGITQMTAIPGAGSQSGSDLWIDNLFIRQYLATEPTVGSPASEEKATSPLVHWSFDEGGRTTIHNLEEKNSEFGLVSWWKMDEGTGTTAYDEMGLNPLTGTSFPAWTTSGKIANALDFEKDSSQYAYAEDSASLSITSDLTISAWIKPESNVGSTQYDIAGSWDTISPLEFHNYLLAQYGDEIRMYLGSSSNYVTTNTVNLATGTWYHVTAVYNASAQTVTIYTNGIQSLGTVTGTIPSSLNDGIGRFHIGAQDSSFIISNFYDGLIDSVKLFNRALPSAEVQADYYSTHGHIVGAAVGVGATWADGAQSSNNQRPLGKSLKFDGTNDAVTAQSVSSNNISGDITVSAWIKPNAQQGVVIHKNSQYSLLMYSNYTVAWADSSNWSYANFGAQNIGIVAGLWNYVTVTKTGGVVKIYLNGVEKVSQSFGSSLTTTANNLFIGCYAGATACGSNYFSGYLDEVKIYNQALSAAQVKIEYNRSTGIALGVGQKPGVGATGPLAWWKFDDASGYSALDSSGNNLSAGTNNFDINTAWVPGKIGKALSFDGNNDYVNLGDQPILDFGTGSFTISGWFRTTNTSNVNLINKSCNGGSCASPLGYNVYFNASDYLCFGIDDDGTWDPDDSACSTTTYYSGNWYHFAAVKNSTSSLQLYVNGVVVGTDTSLAATGTLTNVHNFTIGDIGTSGIASEQAKFNGQVDDIRVYNYARSVDQIHADIGGSPISCWKFNEGVGTTFYDDMKKTNGTLGAGTSAPLWAGGAQSSTSQMPLGKSLQFDGTGDYAYVNNDPANGSEKITLSLWTRVDPSDTTGPIAGNTYGWYYRYGIYVSSGTYLAYFRSTGGTWSLSSNTTYSGNWDHVVLTYDNSSASIYVNGILKNTGTFPYAPTTQYSNTFYIGTHSTSANDWFKGQIDEIKVYNYILTAAEIAQEYNRGNAVSLGVGVGTTTSNLFAWWKFDEGVGTTAYDISTTGNSLFAIGSPVWTIGHQGKATDLELDSTQYWRSTSGLGHTDSITLMTWIKPESISAGSTFTIIDRTPRYPVAGNGWSLLQIGDEIQLLLLNNTLYTATTTGANLPTNQWTHLATVYNTGTTAAQIYLNGSLVSASIAGTAPTALNSDAVTIYLGASQNSSMFNFYDGQIDQVKIFGTALTSAQIAFEYNQGKPVVHFRFDEKSGGTAYDEMDTHISGNLVGSTLPFFTTGKYNNGLSFDGINNYVNIGITPPALNFIVNRPNVSFTAWIKPDAINNYDGIICNSTGGGGTQQRFCLTMQTTNRLRFLAGNSTTYQDFYSSTNSIFPNQWQHIAITVNSSNNVQFYINGKTNGAVQTLTQDINLSTTAWLIGVAFNSPTQYQFDGIIDEAKIYNYTLTADQIKLDYNNGAAVRLNN